MRDFLTTFEDKIDKAIREEKEEEEKRTQASLETKKIETRKLGFTPVTQETFGKWE